MMKFSVPKMKCGGCADAVTTALHKLDATAPVEINLETKEVAFGGNVTQEAVFAALTAAGYPAVSTR